MSIPLLRTGSEWTTIREVANLDQKLCVGRLCRLLCPLNRQMGTVPHSQPHATIMPKLFIFSKNVENRTVVFGSAPALGAGGPRFESGRPDQFIPHPLEQRNARSLARDYYH